MLMPYNKENKAYLCLAQIYENRIPLKVFLLSLRRFSDKNSTLHQTTK